MKFKSIILAIMSVLLVSACQQEPDSLSTSTVTAQLTEATNIVVEESEALVATVTLAVPTPTEAGITPDIRLEEGFDGTESCLESFERVAASAFVFEGQMILDALEPETTVISTCQSLVAGNFILEADTRVLEAPQDAPFYYGLTYRVSGDERYNFVFGSVGGYCAFYASLDSLLHLTNSTDFVTDCWSLPPVDLINSGTNQLRVVAVDDRMDFYLNGELMAVVRDNRLTEGLVGFIVTSGGEGGARVAFDNLRVLRP